MRVAGAISGTSLDGIDVAIVEIDEDGFRMLGRHTVPYPREVRQAILAASNSDTHTAIIGRLNFLLGELFAEAILTTCEQVGIPLASLALIGSHGQTIFHEGAGTEYLGRSIASTLQIGEPAVIAERTGIPVIADFRPGDIAAGGWGAPLVPLADYRLFSDPKINRIALNIGGIANITVLRAGTGLEQIAAFDTGPGNMVMDALMGEAEFDRGGELARQGRVNRALLAELLDDPYYGQHPPKTAGREQYGAAFLERFRGLQPADALATAAELTARTIADAIGAYPDTAEVIVSGGGTYNVFLMERLQAGIQAALKTSAEYGVDIGAKEAIAFAVLAYESFHGRPGNVPGATGARRRVVLGKLTPAAGGALNLG